MTNEEIISKSQQIIRQHLGVDESKVVRDADFYDDLGADSLDMVELTMAFEEEFCIEISDHESESASTVGAVYDLVTAKLGK